MGKLCHVEQIAGNPGHNLAHFCIAVIGKGELLKMLKQIPPHIRLDPRAHHMANVCHEIVGSRVDQPQNQIKKPHVKNELHGQAGHVIHTLVGNKAHNQRQYQLTDRRQRCAEKVQRQYPSVLLKIGRKPLDQVSCAYLFCLFHRFSLHSSIKKFQRLSEPLEFFN